MKPEYVIPVWDIPSLPVLGSNARYPVRRIFCVGRNYVEHQKEMGGDGRELPFFFTKSAHALVPEGGDVHYPLKSSNYHWETEMVAVIGKGGTRIPQEKANEHIFGYGVGLDMTRRDLQGEAKKLGRPWETGKAFEASAPCGPLHPVEEVGHPTQGAVWCKVNGELRQSGDLNQMIWKVPEMIAYLSKLFTLQAGDLIFAGTPAGVGAIVKGDVMVAHVEGVDEITFKVA